MSLRMDVSRRLGDRAAVLGAGIAGLASARALAEHFDEVIIFERDTLPTRPTLRDGTPQARHPHSLLRGGVLAVEQLFERFGEVILGEGAVEYVPQLNMRIERPGVVFEPYAAEMKMYGATRPVFEFAVRTCLAAAANVSIRESHRVRELVGTRDRVTGVVVESPAGRTVERFDFVVDTTGRAAPTLAFLGSHELGQPEEEIVGVDIMYGTTMFERTARADWLGVITFPSPPNFRAAVMTPIEGNRWHLCAVGRHGDDPPTERAAFLEYLRGLPTRTMYDAVADAVPAADIVRYKFPDTMWRHFERFSALPASLLVIGDGVARVNPFYGQGMTLAVRQVEVLRRLLATSGTLDAIAEPFYRDVRDIVDAAWSTATMLDYQHPSTRGERPADLARRLAFSNALARVAARDPEVRDLFWKTQHLMALPSALRERRIVVRVMEELKASAGKAVEP